jgi:hypothetical protein
MLRIILQYVLPFFLPFLLYTAYVFLLRGRTPGWLNDAPWAALAGAGIVVMTISLVTWTLTTGSPPEEAYIPARLEDGRIVPGTTVEP